LPSFFDVFRASPHTAVIFKKNNTKLETDRRSPNEGVWVGVDGEML
jgi:hypothetical protein